MRVFRFQDISLGFIWTLLTIIFVLTPGLRETWIRTLLGIPMVLFIPGYSLIAALFPGKRDLDGIERLALSFGLSIAVVPLLGLALNFTPMGIRLLPILVSISTFSLAMLYISGVRRLKIREEYRVEILETLKNLKLPEGGADRILTIALIISIILALAMIVYVITTPKIGERFTEFYILGPGGKAENYPQELTVGKRETILVGVVNHEYTMVNYTLNISLTGDTLTTRKLTLAHNQTWEKNVSFTPRKKGTNQKLNFYLYKENNLTIPYRSLHLWVNVTERNVTER